VRFSIANNEKLKIFGRNVYIKAIKLRTTVYKESEKMMEYHI
jgi:hypothetical protein